MFGVEISISIKTLDYDYQLMNCVFYTNFKSIDTKYGKKIKSA